MDSLTRVFSGLDEIRFTKGGTFVDRLQYKYTPMLLGVCAVALMAIQFIGDFNISCWCPAQFTDSMVEYTNMKCWTARTYHVPFTTPDIPRDEKLKEHISYYQWVPAILFVQAFMFFIPSQIWRFISGQSGIGVSKIVDKALKLESTEDAADKQAIAYDMAQRILLYKTLSQSKKYSKFKSNIYDNSLPILYMVAKVMYFVNVLLQMKIMNWILGGHGMASYATYVLSHMVENGYWPESARFPTVMLCDFPMRVLHNIQDHTVQCALPLNLYHDKLFVNLWVWYAVLAALTLLGLLSWLFWLITAVFRSMMFVKNTKNEPTNRGSNISYNNERLEKFMWQYFRGNGLFIKRMVESNVGKYTTTLFIKSVRQELLTQEKQQQHNEETKNGCSHCLPNLTHVNSYSDSDSSSQQVRE